VTGQVYTVRKKLRADARRCGEWSKIYLSQAARALVASLLLWQNKAQAPLIWPMNDYSRD